MPARGVRLVAAADVSPRPLPWASTGSKVFDEALAGGVRYPSAVLVGGPPGSGKSTRAMAAAVAIAEARGGRALVVSAEMSADLAKSTMVRGCGGDVGRVDAVVDILDMVTAEGTSDAAPALAIVRQRRPAAVVWDSIQRLDLPGYRGSKPVLGVLMTQIVAAGVEAGTCTLVITQVNASGGASGVKELEHGPDACVMIEPENAKTGAGARLLVSKNRFGPAPLSLPLT